MEVRDFVFFNESIKEDDDKNIFFYLELEGDDKIVNLDEEI